MNTWSWPWARYASRKLPWSWLRSWSNRDVERVTCTVGKSWLGHTHLLSLKDIASFASLCHPRRILLGLVVCSSVLPIFFSLVISHQIRIMGLLFVVYYHCLNIRKHVLSLSKASIFHLAFLYALHTASLLTYEIGTPSIILFITGPIYSTHHVVTMTSVYKGLNWLVMVWVVLYHIFALGSFPRLVTFLFLFFTTIVASVTFTLLGCGIVSMIAVSIFELSNALL